MKQRKRVSRRQKASKKAARIQAKVPRIQAQARRRRRGYLPEELAGMYRPLKRPVTLRLDADILAWFQRDGRGYQTRINEALRKVMDGERKMRT